MSILSGWDRVGKEMRPHWHVACIIELSPSKVTELWGWPKRTSDERDREQQSDMTAGKPICGKVADSSPKSEERARYN